MKSAITLILSAMFMLAAVSANAEKAATEGAELGEWTQDYEAAVKLAQEKKLPILLNFSGSDWCGWCKLMVKNVFSKKEWKDYASENIVTVLIDFPKDKSLVPDKFVDRNEKLQDMFGVRGFPTYVVVDCDGVTELGRLGAGRDVTPEDFINDLSKDLTYCAGQIDKYASSLKEADKKEYMTIMKKLSVAKEGIAESKETIAEAEKKIEELEEKAEEIKDQAAAFRAAQKGPDALKEYKETKAEYDKAVQELEDWFASGPARGPETMRKMREMKDRISTLEDKLAEY